MKMAKITTIKVGTLKKNHKCKICENVYSSKQNLNNHFMAVHDGEELNCNICNKTFQKQNSLEIHIKIAHKSHKDFKCESCGKSFSE